MSNDNNNNTNWHNEICYSEIVDPRHLWGLNVPPLKNPVPQLVIQIALAVAVNHGFLLVFQRLGQPRFVSNLLTALVLSPATLSKVHHKLGEILLPTKSMTILEAIANLGLVYATFIQGLQANDIPLSQTKPKMLFHSIFAFICPFIVGYTLYYFLIQNFTKQDSSTRSNNAIDITSMYWGTIITSTGFTSMAPILSKLKLLCTNIGKQALFIGLFNDFWTWVLINIMLGISTTTPNNKINFLSTLFILLFMALYMIFCCALIKPTISKMINLTNLPEGHENYSNFAAQLLLFLVLASGFLTDYLGSHFIFGAYILGRCVPPGFLAETMIEKMEECVDAVLMPLYFMVIGTKLDIFILIQDYKYNCWVIPLAISTKLLCTLISGLFCNVALGDSLPLGVLLSAKGLLPLVLLNIGHERGLLTSESFTKLFLIILLSTIMVGPIMSCISYKRIRKSMQPNEKRNLQEEFSETLGLITCIHASRNIPSIINLLEISNITPQNPALVHVTHLVELLGHAPTMLIEHGSRKSIFWKKLMSSKFFFDRTRVRSNQIIKAFDEYMEENNNVKKGTFKILTVVSPIETMHEDICSLANDKKTSLIILPFHQQQGVDGMFEDDLGIEFGGVNQKVLEKAPCSVALFVDRGLRILSPSSALDLSLWSIGNREHVQIAMLYVGGSDDREALTYAWRMVMGKESSVKLTVIRFLEGEHVMDVDQVTEYLDWCSNNGNNNNNNKVIDINALYAQKEREFQFDNEFLDEFQQKTGGNDSICCLNFEVNNGDEIIESLRELNHEIDLYIIGRGQSRFSLLTLGLVEWNECKELGIIGNVLVTSDFSSNASLLVMQQNNVVGDKCSQEQNGFFNSYNEP